jgi:hypothetical protein
MAKISYTLILVFTFFTVTNLQAASCCGGGSSAASLIIGDHLQEWTLSTLFRSDIGQTNNDGQSMMDGDENKDDTFTTSLEYKKLFGSRSQANVSINFIQKKSERLDKNESSSGFGDLGIGAFYEAITNYNYSLWNTRLFVGLKAIVPFGENNFNSKKELRTDIRGTGFYKIDVPVVIVKDEWKLSATPQYLPSQKNLSSTYAFTSAASYTYTINDKFDFTATVQWSYLAKKTFETSDMRAGQYWDLSISPSWLFDPNKSLNLTYSDSTLIGKSRNSALYRSVALGMTWSELL